MLRSASDSPQPCPHPTEANRNLGYVQGMSILCAPFIYVMPEVDAFFCFRRLLLRHCPNYVYPMLEGVHAGASVGSSGPSRTAPWD